MSENTSDIIAWTPDEALFRKIFMHLEDASRLSTNGAYQQAVLNYKFAWHIIKVALTDKISGYKEGSEIYKDLVETVNKTEQEMTKVLSLLVPSSSKTQIAYADEENQRIYQLNNQLTLIDQCLIIGLQQSDIWFRKSRNRVPQEAILEKFDMF